MSVETFADVLVRASNAEGSLLGLANRLGVAPALVYRWIARIDQPSEEQRRELHALLSTPPRRAARS
jgi:hypothetical protein